MVLDKRPQQTSAPLRQFGRVTNAAPADRPPRRKRLQRVSDLGTLGFDRLAARPPPLRLSPA